EPVEYAADAGPQQQRILAEDHAESVGGHGILTLIAVGPPAGLDTCNVPPTTDSRACSPDSPEPGTARAPPRPLSDTSTSSSPSRTSPVTAADVACACRSTLASDSITQKYAAVSISAGNRVGSSMSTFTGVALRPA